MMKRIALVMVSAMMMAGCGSIVDTRDEVLAVVDSHYIDHLGVYSYALGVRGSYDIDMLSTNMYAIGTEFVIVPKGEQQ